MGGNYLEAWIRWDLIENLKIKILFCFRAYPIRSGRGCAMEESRSSKTSSQPATVSNSVSVNFRIFVVQFFSLLCKWITVSNWSRDACWLRRKKKSTWKEGNRSAREYNRHNKRKLQQKTRRGQNDLLRIFYPEKLNYMIKVMLDFHRYLFLKFYYSRNDKQLSVKCNNSRAGVTGGNIFVVFEVKNNHN